MSRNVVIGVVVVAVLVAGGWWYMNQSSTPATSELTQTPTLQESPSIAPQAAVKPSEQTSPSPAAGTAAWKTYRSEKQGIEFKYPPSFVLDTSRAGRPGAMYDFELIDSQRNCYIGPLIGTEWGPTYSQNSKTLGSMDFYYMYKANSRPEAVQVFRSPQMLDYFTLASLSSGLIDSTHKSTSATSELNEGCIQDFETIVTTATFTN